MHYIYIDYNVRYILCTMIIFSIDSQRKNAVRALCAAGPGEDVLGSCDSNGRGVSENPNGDPGDLGTESDGNFHGNILYIYICIGYSMIFPY